MTVGTPGEKICPDCGSVLRPHEFPRSLTGVRVLAVDLLFWATVALFLAYLSSPRADGELYAVLGACGLVAWASLRSRQRADRLEFAERGRYQCERCGQRFEGEDLRPIPPIR